MEDKDKKPKKVEEYEKVSFRDMLAMMAAQFMILGPIVIIAIVIFFFLVLLVTKLWLRI